jgi:hypothetical protein
MASTGQKSKSRTTADCPRDHASGAAATQAEVEDQPEYVRALVQTLNCEYVRTYIASGNVCLSQIRGSAELVEEIQEALPKRFELDSEVIKILVPSRRTVTEGH